MVSKKMDLPFYRGRRTVHNTNLLENCFFNNLLWENIQLIFMKFSGFVYHVKDYCCANSRNQQRFFNMFKIELENRDFRKSLYFYIVDAGKKEKKGMRMSACIIFNQ